jgi:DNA mismatch repair protein MutL
MAEKTPVNVPYAPVIETKNLTEVEPAVGEIYGDNDIYVNSTVVGQLFDTYIVLEYRDQLVLLDQHAAHERLMYEKIKKSLDENDIESQILLVPVAIQLAPSEFAAFKANTEFFTKAGFELKGEVHLIKS